MYSFSLMSTTPVPAPFLMVINPIARLDVLPLRTNGVIVHNVEAEKALKPIEAVIPRFNEIKLLEIRKYIGRRAIEVRTTFPVMRTSSGSKISQPGRFSMAARSSSLVMACIDPWLTGPAYPGDAQRSTSAQPGIHPKTHAHAKIIASTNAMQKSIFGHNVALLSRSRFLSSSVEGT